METLLESIVEARTVLIERYNRMNFDKNLLNKNHHRMSKKSVVTEQPTSGTITPLLHQGAMAIVKKGINYLHVCKDAEGNEIMTRLSTKTFVAAVVFFLEIKVGDSWKELPGLEKFYFGRNDLIGKGNSKFYFNAYLTGMSWRNDTYRVSKAIIFRSLLSF